MKKLLFALGIVMFASLASAQEYIEPVEKWKVAEVSGNNYHGWAFHQDWEVDFTVEGQDGRCTLTDEEVAEAETAMIPADSLQRENGEEGLTLEHVLGDYLQEERLVENAALRAAMEELPEKERKVLSLRFYHGLTQTDCARILGISQVQVSRLERRSLDTLRTIMS